MGRRSISLESRTMIRSSISSKLSSRSMTKTASRNTSLRGLKSLLPIHHLIRSRTSSIPTAPNRPIRFSSSHPISTTREPHRPPSHLTSSSAPKKPKTKARVLSEEEQERELLRREEELRIDLKKSFRPPKILFENEKVVVIDKPAGCALQAERGSEAFVRWKIILDHLEEINGQLFLVHRLDKSTTGPLILAKSSTACRTLSTQFKNSTVKKTYLAVIQFLIDRTGPIQDAKASGLIECRMRNRNDRMVIAESTRSGTDCKQTRTDWELITATSNHAIVRLRPQTGRKHQLRLHCSRFLAAPIVGDFKYDFRYLNNQSQKAIQTFLYREATGRVLLHCSEIEFKLYRKEQPREYTVRVSSPVHDDFRIVCDQLDLNTNYLR